ncbi:hypothetical protein BOSE62_80079 [Bosea sp. 62]|nr:hypothetical protein BOSE21B_80076 [Bosea sp. 21B]CAD5292686.1 hypothetical protein BOSE46_80052 [Bosea sp. 46]CAD5300063.1 hypothetical protein BOSE7B_60733 [Bosea sp. 7B]VVT57165.1 hypothetical protein BOS5A_180086 [Bosea sp. EC-HK365B]VXB50158.1 hypothetical protein BOSE127_120197 [Bosea sp. 127]VXC69005.1 hypothetical protein BOSE29B_70052 [Bosea sp. 29B]VXC95827.1 hypothetical protein BOSE62_80079 [Bosea sp. 62]
MIARRPSAATGGWVARNNHPFDAFPWCATNTTADPYNQPEEGNGRWTRRIIIRDTVILRRAHTGCSASICC